MGRAGFVPPPGGYVLPPLPLPSYALLPQGTTRFLLSTTTSVNARLSFVSRWHDKVEGHPNLIIGDHGYRLHPPINAGRQQIPSPIVRVEAQQIGLAFDFKSHFLVPLTFLVAEFCSALVAFRRNTEAEHVFSRVLQAVPVTTRGAARRPCFAKSEKRIANNRSSGLSFQPRLG